MKYKIGDWVKIVHKGNSQCPPLDMQIGLFSRVYAIRLCGNGVMSLYIDGTTHVPVDCVVPCCQHGIVEGEVCVSCTPVVTTPKFKVGDRVVLIKIGICYGGEKNWMFREENVGMEYLIDKVEDDFFVDQLAYVLYKNGNYCGRVKAEDIQKVEEPEPQRVYYSTGATPDFSTLYTLYQPLMDESPKKGTFMRRLSELAQSIRRTFSADQKALWRTGRIDDAGKWTRKAKDEALEEVLTAYLKEHEGEMVSSAQEEIELAKEEKSECE